MIVAGKILDHLAAIVRTRPGPDDVRGFNTRRRYSHEPLHLRSTQPGYMPVTLGHDWTRIIGSVRHIELSGNEGDAWAVADVDDVLREDLPLYFSIEPRGRPDDAELRAIGLTHFPASVGLAPVELLPGDVRGSELLALRLRKSEPHLARLLERARTATRVRRYGSPLLVENRATASHVGHAADPDARPGPIYHSAPYAGVISVR